MVGHTEKANQEPEVALHEAEAKPYRLGGGVMPIIVYAKSPDEARAILADRIAGIS